GPGTVLASTTLMKSLPLVHSAIVPGTVLPPDLRTAALEHRTAHVIDPAAGEGVAAEHPPGGHARSPHSTVDLERVERVLRAAGVVPTDVAVERGDHDTVGPHEPDEGHSRCHAQDVADASAASFRAGGQ